ncbi:hypothetical protein [Bacteroides hominis]|uniref:hypothetical protein n=1 Tax=Bacteroides hominis TaxID=2763023 RepID=UPI00164BFD81|nr:hypothetical protein [Bacteroides hominis (ex Liu et al. 2022)]MBC5612890.1 hypothetical protein [Bacteroides hominis (ex Liu et al. 2022)]
MADRIESELIYSKNCKWVRAIDSNGNSINISKEDLLQGMFTRQTIFEGDVDELIVPGMYYINAITQNANGYCGLFLVFRFDQSVTQFSFNVFNGGIIYRTLLYNNGKWDKWSTWKGL